MPTLADVARLTGVSLKTASRVLNNSKNVSEEKVKRIRAAMKRIVVIDWGVGAPATEVLSADRSPQH